MCKDGNREVFIPSQLATWLFLASFGIQIRKRLCSHPTDRLLCIFAAWCGYARRREDSAHAMRHFPAELTSGCALVKLNFTNAFNSLSRARSLASVYEHIPELYSCCYLAYRKPSVLKNSDYSFQSKPGLHQGDPLRPLLYCLPIQPVSSGLQSTLGYFIHLGWYFSHVILTSLCADLMTLRRLQPSIICGKGTTRIFGVVAG